MNNIKHIFFDLDHTLWDFEKNASLAFEKIFIELAFDIPISKFMEIYNPINVYYWKLLERGLIEHDELRYKRLKDTFDQLEVFVNDETIHLISDLFIDYLTDNNFLIDGTIDVLEYLYPKYDLHVITNGIAHVQEIKMEKSQLSKYFKSITNSELAGAKKPNPIIFEYALLETGVHVDEAIMIGDSWEADIMGATKCGMKAIYLSNKKPLDTPNVLHIFELYELKHIL